MASELKPWRYEIKCGPDDEASHAWIYDEYGEFTAVMKIHKAKQIVDAMNTRPAPAATDTGLETFSVEVTSSGHPYMKSDPEGDYVTRSQAEELLAAERARTERWHKKAMDAGVIVHSDGTTSHPMRKERDDLKADNAAQAARIKELELQLSASKETAKIKRVEYLDLDQDHSELKADYAVSEAQLKAAKKALEPFVSFFNEAMKGFTEGYAERTSSDKPVIGWNNAYLLMRHFIEARAVLGGKPS